MQTPATAGSCGSGGDGSGVDVQQNGADVVNPATILDFTGSGVTVTNGGGGKAIIDIPGGGGGSIAVWKDGDAIVDPATVLNFTGAAVEITDAGSGQADIDIGINIDQNESPKVTRAKEINFSGDAPIDVTVTDLGGGVANVVVGLSSTGAQHSLVSFSGGEDPNDIEIALPVAMAGDYIVQLTFWPGAGNSFLQAFLISQTDEQNFVVGLSASPANGDQLMYSVFLRTS